MCVWHARIHKVLSEGVQLNFENGFFCLVFFMREGGIQITIIAGHYRSTSETPFNGVSLAGNLVDDGPTLNTGLVAL